MKGSQRGIGLLLAAGLVAGAAPAASGDLSAQQARGRQIFEEGTRAAGAPLTARIGMMSQRVRGSVVPCAGCHGDDGRGTGKSGVVRPDITWEHLARPGGHQHDSGRSHPAFTRQSFAAAVTRGIDPAGNRLAPVMPRYELTSADLEDLVAYLEWLPAAGMADASEDRTGAGPGPGPDVQDGAASE